MELTVIGLLVLAIAGGLYTGYRKWQWPENEMSVKQALIHAAVGAAGLILLLFIVLSRPDAPSAYAWSVVPFGLAILLGAWVFSYRWYGWAFPKWAIVLHALSVLTGFLFILAGYGLF